MGSVIHAIRDLGNSFVHTITHTATITIDGVTHAVSVATNEAGEALHDVVVDGKVVVKAGY